MVISRSKITLKLSLLSLAVLPNHDIFNYLFAGTILVIWKQILAILLYALAFHWASKAHNTSTGDTLIKKIIIVSTVVLFIFCIYSITIGVSALRVIYGALSYTGLIGFLYFSSLVAAREKRFKLYKILATISVLSSVGLFLDYFTHIFNFLPRTGGVDEGYYERHDIFKRAAFLFGASTTVVQFQAFGLLASAAVYVHRRSTLGLMVFLGSTFLIVSSLFLTGSRAGFFLMAAYAIAILFTATTSSIGRLHRLLIATGVIIFTLIGIDTQVLPSITIDWTRFSMVFSDLDAGNVGRFGRWQEAVTMILDVKPEWFLGNGLGTTLSNIDDGKSLNTHYESSVFQAFYEGGFGLIFLRYFCLFAAVLFFIKQPKKKTVEQWMLLHFLLLFFISTSVAPTSGAYHTQMVYFLSTGLLISISTKKDFI